MIEMTLHLSEAAAPTFNTLLAEPTEAEVDAIVRGFSDLSPKPWAERFREMQAAGGGIDIKSLHIVQAIQSLSATVRSASARTASSMV